MNEYQSLKNDKNINISKKYSENINLINNIFHFYSVLSSMSDCLSSFILVNKCQLFLIQATVMFIGEMA